MPDYSDYACRQEIGGRGREAQKGVERLESYEIIEDENLDRLESYELDYDGGEFDSRPPYGSPGWCP